MALWDSKKYIWRLLGRKNKASFKAMFDNIIVIACIVLWIIFGLFLGREIILSGEDDTGWEDNPN